MALLLLGIPYAHTNNSNSTENTDYCICSNAGSKYRLLQQCAVSRHWAALSDDVQCRCVCGCAATS
jgi:hypothetical protein